MRKLSIPEILLLLVLVLMAVVGGHLYADNQARSRLWQQTYPLRAKMALQQVQCSADSPPWMADVLRQSTRLLRAPANQLAYMDASGQLYHCESGYTDLPWFSPPLTADSRFRFASVTKLWTSDAVLQLVNEGKLTLDTPLWQVLDDLPAPQDPRMRHITIGQLLLHQGGFDRMRASGVDMFRQGREEICPKHLDRLAQIRLNFDPGSKTAYSNLGYCLLGEVVAKKRGQSYVDYVEGHYRLHHDGLRFIGRAAEQDEVAYNHEEQGLTGIADIYTAFDYPSLASAAGLSGNASGLVRQVKAMLHPGWNITSQPANPECRLEVLRSCYGYAMFPYRASPQQATVYFRDGGLPGLSSVVMVTEQGAVVALLSNGATGSQQTDEIKFSLYRAVTGQP